jgi:membrane-associated phospholipid phosphatase
VPISTLPTWLVISYLVIHSIYILAARYPPPNRWRLLFIDCLLALLFIVQLSTLDSPSLWEKRWFRITVLWSPLVFFWWAYLWVGHTLQVLYPEGVSFDNSLIRLEAKLFGQPSLWLARGRPAGLTDLFHFLYDTYFAYTPVLALYLHIHGGVGEFQSMSFAVILGYAICYTFFPQLPTWGPRWGLVVAGLLNESERCLSGGWMTRATNALMFEGLAHKGCAMPSAHTSTGVVFLVWCWRIWGVAGGFPAIVIVTGMAFAAVYGRYHYLMDILVGAALGVICVLAADWLI